MLDQGQTSGCITDNFDANQTRLELAWKESMPIEEVYEKKGLLKRVVADRSIDAEVVKLIESL